MPHGYHPAPDPLAHGMALGRAEAAAERLIYIAEMHGRTLEAIAAAQARMADALARIEARLPAAPGSPAPGSPAPAAKPPEPMAWKDRLQLAAFGLAAIAVLAGRMPLKEALSLLGRPFGF